MRERVAKRIKGDAAEGLTICTFHALGLKLLQIEHAKLGLRRGFSIFDSDDSNAQIKDLLPPGSKPDVDRRRAQPHLAREERRPVARAGRRSRADVREREAAALYARYQQRLSPFNAVDFDDLIRLPVQLLESDEEACAPGANASATCWSTNARTPTTRSTAC
jgi:ATP-dependent DNA helicase Rep